MAYTITQYNYKTKNGLKMEIYSRTKDFADKILNICNTNTKLKWMPCKVTFSYDVLVDVPPYELEQEQLKSAITALERRKRNAS